ncbi:hypothetical protein V5799_005783 [Amblyomma americanum]|uniref:ABC transporter domain-containing protein n=1 Tax=Amblyomma americanum TaxID=6943 RepID=A0AAQ4DY99_AMBAM
MSSVGFNTLLVRRFATLCSLLFKGKKAVLLLAGLMFVVVTYEFISYQVGLISSRYYRVLQDKDLHGFWIQTALALSLVFAISMTRALRTFLASTAGVHWRKLITADLHGLYFSGKNHYDVNVVEAGVLDNADQRMTQDVDRFCRTLAETLPPALIAPFTAGYYNYQAYVATGWIGPVSTIVFFLVFTVINKFLMAPVGQLRVDRLPGRRTRGAEEGRRHLSDVVKAQQSVVNREFPLNFGIHLFDYTGAILSLLVIAVPIFNGVYDSLTPGELSQLISKNAFVSIYLISCYSSLVDLSGNVAVIAGNTHRIMALREKLQALREELRYTKCDEAGIQKGPDDSDDGRPAVELQDVTYSSPRDGGVLVEKLKWMLDDKRKALITGASGSGKTTLLRVIKGLRNVDSGCVRVRNAHSLAFFPQSPWLTSGSLRKQIRYPSDECHEETADEDAEEAEMVALLELTGLKHLLDSANNLDSEMDAAWYDTLSPGERQRLSWARLLYRRPKLALMDEATAAIDPELASTLYAECEKRGINVAAVSYERKIEGWEPDMVLQLRGTDGYWTVS